MKYVSDLIEELMSLPPGMLVYHSDGFNFTYPRISISETILEGESIRYVTISAESITEASIEEEL